MQKITPFLWFDDQAEEAVNLYVSLFPDSKVVSLSRYGEGGPGPKGRVMTAVFDLAGQRFMALNGGPKYRLNEAFSLLVNVDNQAELDTLWDTLIADGGEPSRCGWLKDRFGVSWQIVPTQLGRMLQDPDPQRAGRVMRAMLTMGKLDIAALQQAHGQP